MFFTWNFVLRLNSIIQDAKKIIDIIIIIYDVIIFADTL